MKLSSQHRIFNSKLALVLGWCLILASTAANALNLGQIEVQSSLNEPLSATIPIFASAEELSTLDVRLASDQVFRRLGIERADALLLLMFEVISINGTPHIKVTSKSLIREPLLEFVLSVNWGNGKILREFAIFLSP